jgi:hypothetical protein
VVKKSFGLMVLKSFIMSSMPVIIPPQMINTSSKHLKYVTFSHCGKIWKISFYSRYCSEVYNKNANVDVLTGKHVLVVTVIKFEDFCFND